MMEQREVEPRSSAALSEATGRDYADWFAALDEWGAPDRPYREIADWLTGQGLSNWWAQKLVVEYEQNRGLRQPGARPDGTFAGGASKTIAASLDRAFAAVSDAQAREQWLPDLELRERTSRPGRSVRFDAADGSRVSVTLEAKGAAKTAVAVEHERLPDAAAAASAKAAWRTRLAALSAVLEA